MAGVQIAAVELSSATAVGIIHLSCSTTMCYLFLNSMVFRLVKEPNTMQRTTVRTGVKDRNSSYVSGVESRQMTRVCRGHIVPQLHLPTHRQNLKTTALLELQAHWSSPPPSRVTSDQVCSYLPVVSVFQNFRLFFKVPLSDTIVDILRTKEPRKILFDARQPRFCRILPETRSVWCFSEQNC